jgi:putative spermidine/putrescine transport system permease protein
VRKGPFFWAQFGVTLLASLFLTVPIALTVLTAFTVNAFRGVSSGLTLDWLSKVLSLYGETVFRSFYLALATLAVCVFCGVPAAYAFVRFPRNRLCAFLEESLVLPLSVPGIAIGLGILLCWGGVNWFRHSWLFILTGHVIYCLPFMVRAVTAVLRIDPLDAQEEAARTMGASFWTRFFGLAVPAASPGIIAGSLQVLTLSIGEFNISWMLQTPFTRTLPAGLADSYASMRLEIGAAYTVVFFVLLTPLLIFTQKAPSLINRLRRGGGSNPPIIKGQDDDPDTLPSYRYAKSGVGADFSQAHRASGLDSVGESGPLEPVPGHNLNPGGQKLRRAPGPEAN